jgi:hypothetical protein
MYTPEQFSRLEKIQAIRQEAQAKSDAAFAAGNLLDGDSEDEDDLDEDDLDEDDRDRQEDQYQGAIGWNG